jgi:hypothetical protein
MADRALLVGINAYPGQPLNGCVNDVNDMANFLVSHLNFDSGDIRLLVDARATTKGISDRLEWLTKGAKPGDRLYFHYSGHGALFPVRNAAGKVTAVHDTICPVDFDWTPEHALIDDDLRKLFDVVPAGVEFLYVSDSCNSGDLTRAFLPWRPRVYQAPADIEWRLRTAADKGIKPSEMVHDSCALISGCRSDQESADAQINGRFNGALTYYLIKALTQPAGQGLPLSTLVPNVVTLLKRNHYSQEPQLRGPDNLTGRSFLATGAATGGSKPAHAAKKKPAAKKKHPTKRPSR